MSIYDDVICFARAIVHPTQHIAHKSLGVIVGEVVHHFHHHHKPVGHVVVHHYPPMPALGGYDMSPGTVDWNILFGNVECYTLPYVAQGNGFHAAQQSGGGIEIVGGGESGNTFPNVFPFISGTPGGGSGGNGGGGNGGGGAGGGGGGGTPFTPASPIPEPGDALISIVLVAVVLIALWCRRT